MRSKVYFTDMRASTELSLIDKVGKLFHQAGLRDIVAPGDLVAIKLHFGEKGNTGYIRPQFIRRIVDEVRNAGGNPFLTDANTLYVGTRSNAVDHLQTAIENGFAYAVVNAPLIIADGLNGKDYVQVPVNLKHCKEAKIGSAVALADVLIAVSHFKAHESAGIGGTIKNVGMGCGSRAGKQVMHSDLIPAVDMEKCRGCSRCNRWCPAGAIAVGDRKVAVIDERKCIGCGECAVTCRYGAVKINWRNNAEYGLQEKMVEYAAAVLLNKKGKSGFFNFLMNITPDCDCVSYTDAPVVRDIGILASLDPVAIDQASADLVNKEQGLPGTKLAGSEYSEDKFAALYPDVNWRRQLEYGEEIGLGTRNYELVRL
ncbi:MAG: DUF362 domain-containing protein [Peptococcaceae bacterium]|nr:DUF362 domain-containing protein [Peptococcaceae bacterium]